MSGKNLKTILLCVLVVTFLVGCISTGSKNPVADNRNDIKASEVVQKVNDANNLFEAGDYSAAEKIYQDLLVRYDSRDHSFETAVLVNLCMLNLETGERNKFKDCAEKVKKESKDLTYISRETQMVLELSEMLGDGDSNSSDLRIESRISSGIKAVFKEGE